MGKHKWIRETTYIDGIPDGYYDTCELCSIGHDSPGSLSDCPKSSTTGEGDTKANRTHEAGEVEELKFIAETLKRCVIDPIETTRTHTWEIFHVKTCIKRLEQLIQKREGL